MVGGEGGIDDECTGGLGAHIDAMAGGDLHVEQWTRCWSRRVEFASGFGIGVAASAISNAHRTCTRAVAAWDLGEENLPELVGFSAPTRNVRLRHNDQRRDADREEEPRPLHRDSSYLSPLRVTEERSEWFSISTLDGYIRLSKGSPVVDTVIMH